MLERGGNLIVKVVPNTRQKTLKPIIKESVKEGSTLYSDD
jgi:transposase-like protein